MFEIKYKKIFKKKYIYIYIYRTISQRNTTLQLITDEEVQLPCCELWNDVRIYNDTDHQHLNVGQHPEMHISPTSTEVPYIKRKRKTHDRCELTCLVGNMKVVA